MPPAALSSPRHQPKTPASTSGLEDHRVSPHQKREKMEDEANNTTTPKRRGRPLSKMSKKSGHLSGDDNISISEDDEGMLFRDFEEFSDDDDFDRATSSKRNPNYRIVTVGKSGRPTEVFRTDKIHLLRTGHFNQEDSDEECGPNNGLLKLTDRWREEWNHGVQVPVNARDLPRFETGENDLVQQELAPFQMPSKYIGFEPECSSASDLRHPASPSKYVRPETHSIGPIPKSLLYQADRMDEIWLEKKNERLRKSRQQPYDIHSVAEVINCLEINCFKRLHEELLAPLQPADSNGIDEEAACDVCGHPDCEKDDEMVFCDGCNVCVHLSCYGLEEAPKEDWLCMRCTLSPTCRPPCLLCPIVGGALKCTEKLSDGKLRWAHISCALWIPECKFDDPERREPITAINDILDDRWSMKCAICDTRHGACIQCSVPSCTTAFHVGCAMRSGLEMRIEQDPEDPEGDRVHFVSLCDAHRSAKPLSKDGDCKAERDGLNSKLEQLEKSFFLFASEEQVVKELKYDRHFVSDVYEYWKLKRNARGGHPLLRNPQDDISLLPTSKEAAVLNDDGSMLSRIDIAATRFRNSLLNGRDLISFEQRRQKFKANLLEADHDVVLNVWQQLLSPVPMSDRATNILVDSFKKVLTPEWTDSFLSGEEELLEDERELGRLTLTPSTRSSSSTPVPTPSSQKRIRKESGRDRTSINGTAVCKTPVSRKTSAADFPVQPEIPSTSIQKSASEKPRIWHPERKTSFRRRLTSTGSDNSHASDSTFEPSDDPPSSPSENHRRTENIDTRESRKRRTLSMVPGFVESLKRNSEDFSYLDRDTPSPLPMRMKIKPLTRSGNGKSPIVRRNSTVVSPSRAEVELPDLPQPARITRSHRCSM